MLGYASFFLEGFEGESCFVRDRVEGPHFRLSYRCADLQEISGDPIYTRKVKESHFGPQEETHRQPTCKSGDVWSFRF